VLRDPLSTVGRCWKCSPHNICPAFTEMLDDGNVVADQNTKSIPRGRRAATSGQKAGCRRPERCVMVKRESGSPDRFKGHPRPPAKFRERELARALRAANRAGGIARVELKPDGSIHLIPAGQAPVAEPNPWDQDHAAD